MALSVQTNNAAITALKNLNINNANMNQSLTRLSTGFRINSAADDSSGFAVSSKLDAQTQRLKAASLNATQAQAMTKMADAGVNEIQNMIARIQVLATQASSANNAGELGKLDAERIKLESAIDKISQSTNYNGVNLLNGVDASKTTNATSGSFATQTSISAAAVTTFQNAGLGASYTVATAANGTVTITGSGGATGTGTFSGSVAAAAATASGTLTAATATTTNTTVAAVVNGGTLSQFSTGALGVTFDVRVNAFGTITVLDAANTAGATLGTGLIDPTKTSNVKSDAVAATAGTTVVGANTSITTFRAFTTAEIIATSSGATVGATGNNDTIQASIGSSGASVAFYDVTTSQQLTITRVANSTTIALVTAASTATGTSGSLTIAGNKAYAITLSNGALIAFSTAATLDATATHLAGSSGGTLDLNNGVAAANGSVTVAVTVNGTSELLTLDIKGTAVDVSKLSTTGGTVGLSAGEITGLGGNTASAAGTENITLSDSTVINVSYTGSSASAASSALGASSGTQTAAYTAALDFQVGADNTVNNKIGLNLTNKYTTTGLGLGTGDLLTQANAQQYMDTAKAAMNTLITQRADLGATQNQIGFIQANISTSIEQSMAAVSSIRDTDMAAEMANFTKNKILTQAGTSMLAQANQAAQNILTLFR